MSPETVADTFGEIAISLRRGTAVTTCIAMIYGGHTGASGDLFVAIAQSVGVNISILLAAAITLYGLYGAMILVHGIVVAAVILRQTLSDRSGMPRGPAA